jgi:hypothetical protein
LRFPLVDLVDEFIEFVLCLAEVRPIPLFCFPLSRVLEFVAVLGDLLLLFIDFLVQFLSPLFVQLTDFGDALGGSLTCFGSEVLDVRMNPILENVDRLVVQLLDDFSTDR